MGRRNSKSGKLLPFIPFRREMFNDPKWRKLSSSAKILWIYFKTKHNNKTKDEITMTYKEMSDIMAPGTLSRAFKELEKQGWLKKVKLGGLYGGACKYKIIGEYAESFRK